MSENVKIAALLAQAKEQKSQGRLDDAIAVLKAIIIDHPEVAIVYNNLGGLYFAQQKFQESVNAYQKALDLQPDLFEAYYNLGLALTKLNQITEAQLAYESLLAIQPDHLPALFQLGCLLMRQDHYQKANDLFLKVNEQWQDHAETKTNIATCYLKLGNLALAKQFYLEAAALLPNDTQVLFNLGVIAVQQDKLQEAVHYYQQVVALDPAHIEAQQNLGFIFLVIKNKPAAIKHFSDVLHLQPENKAVAHTLHILTQDKQVTHSPPEYIQSLFDSYADHYDQHLTAALHFKVPQLLHDAFQRCVEKNYHGDVLDLGCGTGLSGALFKPFANKLSGIDLSFNMLALAKEKQLYDDLYQADIAVFLSEHPEQYDVIVASDVLVYAGDLSSLFASMKAALKPKGYVVFNAEINEQRDYELTESGRFTHSKAYLDALIAKNGFMVLSYDIKTLRTQDHKPVEGHVYVLQVQQNISK
jgi:predicted TPR repeat methyltransferase